MQLGEDFIVAPIIVSNGKNFAKSNKQVISMCHIFFHVYF